MKLKFVWCNRGPNKLGSPCLWAVSSLSAFYRKYFTVLKIEPSTAVKKIQRTHQHGCPPFFRPIVDNTFSISISWRFGVEMNKPGVLHVEYLEFHLIQLMSSSYVSFQNKIVGRILRSFLCTPTGARQTIPLMIWVIRLLSPRRGSVRFILIVIKEFLSCSNFFLCKNSYSVVSRDHNHLLFQTKKWNTIRNVSLFSFFNALVLKSTFQKYTIGNQFFCVIYWSLKRCNMIQKYLGITVGLWRMVGKFEFISLSTCIQNILQTRNKM